jgi:hypothetical protein
MSDVYERLRAHQDTLPGGFPATERGMAVSLNACSVPMKLSWLSTSDQSWSQPRSLQNGQG